MGVPHGHLPATVLPHLNRFSFVRRSHRRRIGAAVAAAWALCVPAGALGAVEGLDLPCPEADGARRGWFVYVVQLPPKRDRDGVIRALAEQGIPSRPYFPAIHLMSYYREQFGHREGEFPVCEDVAARSISLPFFPDMGEAQVARVSQALRDVLSRPARAGSTA